MKDIPAFTTENGVASLSLQQIPYTGIAHIKIHSSAALPAFLNDCVGFCCAVGAKQVLACGHSDLEQYPIYTRILTMQMPIPENVDQACLFPVTEKTLANWLEIYNESMKNVPNASFLSKRTGEPILQKNSAYFVHDNGALLGIGLVEDDKILAVASCKKGAGERVMCTLFGAICGDTVKLEVAENNLPAMKLYRRMGFVITGVQNSWFDITKKLSLSRKNT